MNPIKPCNYFYAFSGLTLALGLSMALQFCSMRAHSEPAGRAPASLPDLPHQHDVANTGNSPQDEGKVQVTSITISGNQALSTGELQQLVAGMVGSRHSLDQLNAAARRITAYYRERGFIAARAYLAQQNITDGVVGILVTEGRAPPAEDVRNEPKPGDRGLMLLHLLRSQR